MPNFIQKLFTNPETFRRIRPDLFWAWLKQSENYFTKRGVIIPADCSGFERDAFRGGFDYERLVRVFMEPTPDIPPALVEGLHMIHEMGTPKRYSKMLAELEKNGLRAELEKPMTPLDVALLLFLHDPKGLEDLHATLEVTKRRKYDYFQTDAYPIPRFEGPTLEQKRELERQLSEFYVAWGRAAAVKVSSFSRQRVLHGSEEWLFLVQHTAPPRCEEVLRKGVPRPLLFLPWIYSRLKYDPLRGEMGVSCKAEHERTVLLKIFGRVLFGRGDFFPISAKYDLLPIVRDGRAVTACRDVPGIEHVAMTGVEFHDRDAKRRSIHHAPDIFSLVERDELKWPNEIGHIASATFAVKLWRQKQARKVTIMPSNRALYTRDEESPILELWFEARRLSVAFAA
jgi:hypothetical protein